MNQTSDRLETRLRYIIWIIPVLIALFDAEEILRRGFSLRHDKVFYASIGYTLVFLCIAMTLSWLMRHKWPDKAAANGIEAIAQFMACLPVFGILSYLIIYSPIPYFDASLLKIDRELGFNSLSYLAWANARPIIANILMFCYDSYVIQIINAIIILALLKHFTKLYLFVLAIFFSALICIIISGSFPIMGGYTYLNIDKSAYPNLFLNGGLAHMGDLTALRNGTLRILPYPNFKGLIMFPSFHSCMAIVLIWAFWNIPWLRWPIFLLNILLLAATPINGGHYMIDVIAGILIAIITISALKISMKNLKTSHFDN